ncbi:hypothetical protein PPL_02970 [Heterostelium album PN500]|uniref:Uncharacterized protein n=1 Tax=Heterostelium pallidum (strain ATCC 26659 / Pp 5 / PN500) TaxID=670386 RepID=D3B3K2_HETP5|nr:hypothetical protein PPL_02970 [Heterostelium album PN500]EFA83900.1 hypothetical protein PPL_02970 [Heterostelium album PN500]|eukprot:XP_020436017.1 hypothetical protein PPL_02970 [Heterostelium album PN500]
MNNKSKISLYLFVLFIFLILNVYGETYDVEYTEDYKYVENIDEMEGLDEIEYTEYIDEIEELHSQPPTKKPKEPPSPCNPKCDKKHVCKDYVCQLKCQFVLCKPNYFCAYDTVGFGYCLPNSKKS